MYEKRTSRLAPRSVFRKRLIKSSGIAFIILILSLMLGVMGYHYLGDLGWIDSFQNAAMILGGMGPVDTLKNSSAKIFAGCYAIFCGLSFLVGMAFIIGPILHRFLHKFHLDLDEEDED